MNRYFNFIFLLLTCASQAQQSQAPAIRSSIKEQIAKITIVLMDYDKKLETNSNQLKELAKRNDLSEAERKKLESFVESNEGVQLELLSVKTSIEELNVTTKKQSDDIDGLKAALETVASQKDKLNSVKISLERLANAPEDFKAFTRMSYKGSSKESRIDLEASIGGKRIPLVDKKVSVSLQYKDGPLTGTEEFKTDTDGIVRVAKISVRGMPAPTYRVFRFDGDANNRPSQTRVKIR